LGKRKKEEEENGRDEDSITLRKDIAQGKKNSTVNEVAA